jgi:putative acetyltransferase
LKLTSQDRSRVIVLDADTPEQLDDVRALMRSFVAWHRAQHADDLRLIDGYFDAAAFEDEVAGLPGKYARPVGRLLLASLDGGAAGCVALRSLGDGACEMKRMFVQPEARGHGAGRALSEVLIAEARIAGYRAMRLDTSIRQVEAQALYRSLGFKTIAPYYELPRDLVDWLVFMELALVP